MIELVTYKRPKTRFVGIVPPKCNDLIGNHPNLTLRSGVPESELLALYRTASLMVLPLKDATANNAVLESMACGLPQVITDVGSTCDYVSPDCAVLTPLNDARKMAEITLDLLDAPEELVRMSSHSIVQAGKFSWPAVVKQLDAIYSAVA